MDTETPPNYSNLGGSPSPPGEAPTLTDMVAKAVHIIYKMSRRQEYRRRSIQAEVRTEVRAEVRVELERIEGGRRWWSSRKYIQSSKERQEALQEIPPPSYELFQHQPSNVLRTVHSSNAVPGSAFHLFFSGLIAYDSQNFVIMDSPEGVLPRYFLTCLFWN
jgi:hypothetical protein